MPRIHHLDLYVRSMGKLLKVQAAFPSGPDGEAAANALMERESMLAVVADTDGLILLASKYDKGEAAA